MALTVPTIDDREYEQILAEALARIPVHNPEWTNFNDSDPGMTLVQLFSFLMESVAYRANQIPERSRKKFLSLLGIPLQPATAAKAIITINNERGPRQLQHFPQNLDVRAGGVRFRTNHSLVVLPIEARSFLKMKLPAPVTQAERDELSRYQLLYSDLLESPETTPAFYTSTPLPQPTAGAPAPSIDLTQDTVDACLWLALLARPQDKQDIPGIRTIIGGQPLVLGVVPGSRPSGVTIHAGDTVSNPARPQMTWEIAAPPPGGVLPPAPSDLEGRAARYTTLQQRTFGLQPPASPGARQVCDTLATPFFVELTLPQADGLLTWSNLEPAEEGTGDFPPSLAETDLADRVITWVRLRMSAGGGALPEPVSWVGINATSVEQRTFVSNESPGRGTGEPDQELRLANTPVLPETLTLAVNSEPWHQVDDLLAANPEISVGTSRRPLLGTDPGASDRPGSLHKVFTLDPGTGLLSFGDGAHGARPPLNAAISASYSYGGGAAGNVPVGAISRGAELPPGFKITNPVRAWGGADAEDQQTAERTMPRTVAHRDRLVSLQDFKDVTLRTPGVDLGRVEVLPLYDAAADQPGVPGAVTVVVIPRTDNPRPAAPQPGQLLLEAVACHLEPRRLVTTELHVRGPQYRDAWVSIGLEVMAGRPTGGVIEAVKQDMHTFLSPLTGGRDQSGWPMGAPVLARELEAIANRVDGVRFVNTVLVGGREGGPVDPLELRPLELPRVAAVEVRIGQPAPLDDLRGFTLPGPLTSVPIPVVPVKC